MPGLRTGVARSAMAYDEVLANRIRAGLAEYEPAERKMFGGLTFMVRGNLACGAMGADLIVRIAEEEAALALREAAHIRPFDFTGRPMRRWLVVAAPGIATDEDLAYWLGRGAAYALSLPPK